MADPKKCIVCGGRMPENTTPSTNHIRRAKWAITCKRNCAQIFSRVAQHVHAKYQFKYKHDNMVLKAHNQKLKEKLKNGKKKT